MVKNKNSRTRGKLSFTRYFQTFKPGDYVAVNRETSEHFGYSNRIQGRTGVVIAKRGNAYYVEIKELNKPKRYSIKPIHLRKITVK
jgi:large subunit ribosomal protein L21e